MDARRRVPLCALAPFPNPESWGNAGHALNAVYVNSARSFYPCLDRTLWLPSCAKRDMSIAHPQHGAQDGLGSWLRRIQAHRSAHASSLRGAMERPDCALIVKASFNNTSRRITFPSASRCRLNAVFARVRQCGRDSRARPARLTQPPIDRSQNHLPLEHQVFISHIGTRMAKITTSCPKRT